MYSCAVISLQLFARLGAKQSLGTLDLPLFSTLPSSPGGGLCPGDVVEMTGGEGSGKTEMLLNITAQCVLPRWWGGREVGGKAVEVVWVSTDHKFDVLRLAAILEVKLHRSDRAAGQGKERGMARAVTDITDVDFEGLISTCLSRVHVLYCNSSTELAAALQSLRLSLLRQRPDVCSLVIDNVAEFYWRDRAEAGSVRGCETRQAQWVGTLRSLVEESHVVVFAAKPLLFAQQVSSNGKAGSKVSNRYNDDDTTIYSLYIAQF